LNSYSTGQKQKILPLSAKYKVPRFTRDFLLFYKINTYINKKTIKEVFHMAINPYLPDMSKIENSYLSAQKEPELIQKKLSLSRPYLSAEEVLREIDAHPDNKQTILSKMSSDLRKDRREMLKIIAKHADAYQYVHKDICDDRFRLDAVYRNPNVYSLLSSPERSDPDTIKEYWGAMTYRRMAIKKIDATTEAMQLTQRLSDRLPADQAFSDQQYREVYQSMIQYGPYAWRPDITAPHNDRKILGEDFLYLTTARMMRPDNTHNFDAIERDLWLEYVDKVKELAFDDRRSRDVDNVLLAIEERCPELTPVIQERQKDYWQTRKQEIADLQVRAMAGEQLRQQELATIREGMRHIEFDKKEREELAKRVLKSRQESVYALQRDSIENAYAAHIRGDVEFDTATGIASYIEVTPSTGTPARSVEYLSRAEAAEGTTHNVVEHGSATQQAEERYDAHDQSLEDAQIQRSNESDAQQIAEEDARDLEIEQDAYNDRVGLSDDEPEEDYSGPFYSPSLLEEQVHVYNPFK
jgi:hypothetical protein